MTKREDGLPPIPMGMQKLLRRAAADAECYARVLAVRGEAAEGVGIELNAREKAMLGAVTEAQLRGMIETLRPEPDRRGFLQQAVLLGGVTLGLTGCEEQSPVLTAGVRPDVPPPTVPEVVPSPSRSDETPPPPAGIQPDVPPERPEHPGMQTKGGAEPSIPGE